MDHLDPSQGAERRQADQKFIPQECRCGCHLLDEDGLPLARHDEPCCEPCLCGLNFSSGLDEHQRRCPVYLASQNDA